MLGVGHEGVAREVAGRHSRRLEEALERAHALVVDLDVSGAEVDVELGEVVDATEVAHEDVIDVDPDVVVSGEFELHVAGAAVVVGHSSDAVFCRLDELRGHRQAEVVVQGRGLRAGVGINLAGGVEREEHAVELPYRAVVLHCRAVVDLERVGRGVIGREVMLAVVLVIATNGLEQPLHAEMRLLARPGAPVEEVGKGLGGVGVAAAPV